MKIVKNRFIFIAIAVVAILAGVAAMVINSTSGKGAFNYDVQFTGGTAIEIDLGQEFENDDITKIVEETTGTKNPQVQKIGDGHSVTIKTATLENEQRDALTAAICEKYSLDNDSYSIEDVSATISNEMQHKAFLSVIVACLAMLIYITLRFNDFKTGASSIFALIHDVAVVIAFYAIFRIPLNNSFIAALLTVLGYSINASIVIFDRVRENKNKLSKASNEELIDTSISQTFRRSLFTSLTTFLTLICLCILGVPSVREFAMPIAVGVVCGTFSSICLSGSFWYIMTGEKKGFEKKTAEAD